METPFFDRLVTFANCQNGLCGWNWASAGFMYSTCDDVVFCGDCHVEIPSTTEQDPGDQRSCHRTSANESVENMVSENARLRTLATGLRGPKQVRRIWRNADFITLDCSIALNVFIATVYCEIGSKLTMCGMNIRDISQTALAPLMWRLPLKLALVRFATNA